jgi:hypothetical protein
MRVCFLPRTLASTIPDDDRSGDDKCGSVIGMKEPCTVGASTSLLGGQQNGDANSPATVVLRFLRWRPLFVFAKPAKSLPWLTSTETRA